MTDAQQTLTIHVLIVERTDEEAATLSAMLQRAFGDQITVDATTSEAAAIDLLSQQAADLIISTVRLGAGDGLALCKRVRAMPATAPTAILLLGQNSTAQEKIAGFMSGADDYIVRPIDERLLVARIRLLWRLKHLGKLRAA